MDAIEVQHLALALQGKVACLAINLHRLDMGFDTSWRAYLVGVVMDAVEAPKLSLALQAAVADLGVLIRKGRVKLLHL